MTEDYTDGKVPPPERVKVTKANYMLQVKVGGGPLDEKAVARSQKVIDTNTVDFAPMAAEFLQRLEEALQYAKADAQDKAQIVQMMTEPVMQLKAHASIFHYSCIGTLANIMMGFLESVSEIDATVLEIVEAHHRTLSAIVANKMTGDGGAAGKKMEEELKAACARYFAKKKP